MKISPSGTIGLGSGPAADAASPCADDDDADRPAATVRETATSSANPGESPERRPSDSADCVREETNREVPTETAPAPDGPSAPGASQSTRDDVNHGNIEEAVRTGEKPSVVTILTGDCGQSTNVGGDNGEGGVPSEPREEKTNQEMEVVEAAGVKGTNFLSQLSAESLSGTGAGDKKRESRAELGRARSTSKVSRKTNSSSVSAENLRRRSVGGSVSAGNLGRRSVGGASGVVVEPPANTPHLQV